MCSNLIRLTAPAIFLLVTAAPAFAQKFYTYVGDIGPTHVTLAWGTTSGDNTIGRSSASHGAAVVRIDNRDIRVDDKNWTTISDLTPDTSYDYQVVLKGTKIAESKFRTWPERSERLRFFVIGDFGSGDRNQRRVAEAMWKEFQRLDGDNPVRFVITTGDNIYGSFGFTLRYRNTGSEDDEWEDTFFAPYEQLIARIPFFASLGNHDGNESEGREDLATYLDNFFFPSPQPARYYRFSYGDHVDFFALDSTTNSEEGPTRPNYVKDSDQHKWLVKNLGQSRTPWKIPYMHHPPYNGGPRHPAVRKELRHFIDAFSENGVRVVFTGHEHNFQYSSANRTTDGIRYVVTGAGGELRTGTILREMQRANIEGWSPQLHFLSVEIEGKEMRINPVSFEEVSVVDRSGKRIKMPLLITLK